MKKILFLTKFAVCFFWLLLASAANGIGSTPPGPQLPPLSDDPPERLRGAQLVKLPDWSNPSIFQWQYIEDFPKWGGNNFRLFIEAFRDGTPLLPGQPLTLRVAESLKRFTTVIDWALQHNVYVIINFNPYSSFPLPGGNWPDDGRSLWKDASAQDELLQAWADLAKHYKGRKGIIFDLINEPHGITADEIAGNHALPKKVWNTLYPRLIDAIRAEDPERWIIVEPIWADAFNFVDFSVSSAVNLIYAFHFYSPHFFTAQGQAGRPPAQSVTYPGVTQDSQFEPAMYWDKSVLDQRLQPAINFRNAHSVRVMCGEFGANVGAPDDSRGRWFADVIDLLETNGFDWSYFQYESRRDGKGSWTFEATSFESVVTSKFSLNLEYGEPHALSINDVAVNEGNSGTVNALFTVSLSAASTQTVTVNFNTADDTATAGSDYATTSGVLTFNPGETTKTVTVVVNGDGIAEPNETFFVNLTGATNAIIVDGQGRGTIINDDGVPTTVLVGAVLPGSRSVQVGTPATAFVTIINAGSAPATGVGIALNTSIPASLTYQTTDPATNAVIGTANTPVDIPAGANQSFVIALTPHAPIAPTDVEFSFAGTTASAVAKLTGINTLLFSASATPVADIVALAATLSNDGMVNIPGTNRTGAFAVATVNVGASGSITASADTGTASLPVNISLCQTDPGTGQCISVDWSQCDNDDQCQRHADVWDLCPGRRQCAL